MKYFTIKELTRSSVATQRGWDNTPPPAAEQNLRSLVENVLDPLREAFGRPIYVNSGYRTTRLNKAVGGTPNSQHLRGQAADIRAATPLETRRLGRLLQASTLPFDQLIFYPNFIHVSWNNTPRHQVLYR